MNERKILEHPTFGDIRTITEGGKTLFCGKDVAEALGCSSCIYSTRKHMPSAPRLRVLLDLDD